MRGSLAAGLAILATAVLAGCGCSDENGGNTVNPPVTGTSGQAGGVPFRFEQFTSAPLVDSGEITLDSLRGRVVVLDLFSTWRPACRRTTPLLVSLYERFRMRGFQVVGLAYERSLDPAQQKETVRAFRQEFAIPYPLALGPASAQSEVAAKTGAGDQAPTLVLMDRQGTVRAVFIGLKPGEEATLADRIEKLLAEPPAP
jgi:thiol-disulfide isomerase/thioredoxin